jgi:hypothetical protein
MVQRLWCSLIAMGSIATAALLTAPVPPATSQEHPTLFLGIAAYRDIRCGITLFEAYTSAAHPEKLYCGAVDQFKPGDTPCIDEYCKLMTRAKGSCLYKDQIKVKRVEWTHSAGPIPSRAYQDELVGDQEMCLQVDAHSKFKKGFDDKLLDAWKMTGNDFAVLTTYIHDIGAMDEEWTKTQVPHVCKTQLGGHQLPRNSQATIVQNIPKPKLVALWCAGLSYLKVRGSRLPSTH